jgi:hypothetical protein
MQTFIEWLHLLERYYGINAGQYNQLFDQELAKVIGRVSDPDHRAALERMKNFDWLGYVAASLRHAGYRDRREIVSPLRKIV